MEGQKKIIQISDQKIIKIFKKPFTKKILDCFDDKPKTASEIANSISFPKEKIYYHIVSKMANDTFKVRVCQSLEGSLKEFCGKIIIRFVMREYWNEEETLCVLSIEKLGEF